MQNFSNLATLTSKESNFIKNLEKTTTTGQELLRNEEIVDKVTYKNVKSLLSRPGIVFLLCKK